MQARVTASPARPAVVAAALAATFLVTRAITFWMWRRPEAEFVANDVSYYGYHLFNMVEKGQEVMQEYPMPAVWILQAIYQVGGGWQTWFPWFAGFMLVLDAVVAISLFRASRPAGGLFWILFTFANGAIVWFRFDLIPAALVAWACVYVSTRPRVAGAALAAGAAVKLWPALLAFPLFTPRLRRGQPALGRLLGFIVVGLGLGLASLAAVGWSRSASPITWQGDRGLQIESVPATPLMFLRTFTDNPNWPMALSEYNAIELIAPSAAQPEVGAGVGLMLTVSTVLTVASFILTAVLTWRLVRAFDEEVPQFVEALLLSVLAIVLAIIMANKTLSPQYILWVGGPVAVLLLRQQSDWLRRPTQVLAFLVILLAALTQYTYPWGTYGIMGMPNGSGPETSVLILRNLLVVGLTLWVTRLAWRATESSRGLRVRWTAEERTHRGDVALATDRDGYIGIAGFLRSELVAHRRDARGI